MHVSYGLSELYTPGPNDDPAWWGWGFELSFRIATAGEEEPPEWPFIMLNEMAKHVRTNKVLLEPGDRVDFGRPISGYPDVRSRNNVATHEDLKAGVLARHTVFVTVSADDFIDAECTAAQMAMALTDMMPTATNLRI